MNDPILLKLWGKTKDKSDPDPKEYHPLLYHLIDVGVAAEALWPLLPPSGRGRILQELGVTESDGVRALVLLIALHDLGKASGFQGKVCGLWQKLGLAGITIERVDTGAHHAFVTTATLPELLLSTDSCGVRVRHRSLAVALANALGAHHGTFPSRLDFGPEVLGGSAWSALRQSLAERLTSALFPGMPVVTLEQETLHDPAAGVLITGLTAVADWIGSNQRYFYPSKEQDIEVYTAHARAVVQSALKELGWTPAPTFTAPRPFSELTWAHTEAGKEVRFSPRGVQALVEKMVSTMQEPFLLLAEAAMGEGKTEAALFALDHALTARISHGAVIGLPTQATGNAMFVRVKDFLEARGHSVNLNLQLLHGQAEFHEAFKELCQLGANSAKGEDAPVVAQSWFTKKKQALLAPFGVGTIDQSLMGVLQTKHWFVRLFGLAGKVVIFDEVHAYDAYMNALLKRLIAWLSALDCSVILLSATLPASVRKELIASFAPDVVVPEATYPRVTLVPRSGAPLCESAGLPKESKAVVLETHPPDYPTLAEKLQADLPGGGCGVVICNTVRNAQAAFTAFRQALPEDWEVVLFHARTPLKWRKEREEEVLNKLGKPSRKGVERPERLVLIGTQVLEQSLDYDADWMASEFAPIDLLLQRMGRLWRHEQEREARNAQVGVRRFTVLVGEPAEPEGLPRFPDGSHGDFGVYEDYLLYRTYLALKDREQIQLPHEIESLVQAVYDTPEPEGLSEVWTKALNDSKRQMQSVSGNEENQAEASMVPPLLLPWGDPLTFDDITHQAAYLRDDDDPETHKHLSATTRLGDPSVTLVCLRQRIDGSAGKQEPFCGGKAGDSKDLLLSALSVSRPKGFFFELLKQPVPEGWADNAHLRYARAAYFNANGTAQVGPYKLTLSQETGLSVEKEEAK